MRMVASISLDYCSNFSQPQVQVAHRRLPGISRDRDDDLFVKDPIHRDHFVCSQAEYTYHTLSTRNPQTAGLLTV